MQLESLPRDIGTIAVCALRYCHGRCSYMPSFITDWVKEHWLQLPPGDRQTILRDTRELLASGRDLGDSCDVATWKIFLLWIEERS